MRPAAVAFGARIVALAATFAMNVVIAQTLDIADAGTVVVVLTLVTTFATVGRFGTDNLALRITASDPARMRRLARSLVVVALIASGVASVAFVVAASQIVDKSADPGESSGTLWILVLGGGCVVPAALSVLAAAVMRGAGRLGAGTMAELGSVPVLVSLGLLVANASDDATVLVAVAATCIAFWVTAAWSGVAAWRVLPAAAGPALALRPTAVNEGRSLVHFLVTALATFFLVWVPVLALGFVGTTVDVALYNSGARLAAFVGLVSAIQVSYLATEFAKLGALGDTAAINRVAQRATRQATLVASVVAVAFVVAPELFLDLFGEAYAAAGPILFALTVGSLAQVVAGPSIAILLTTGGERVASSLTFVACAATAILAPLLAALGPAAVAWGAGGLMALPAVVGAVELRKRGIRTSLLQWGKDEQSPARH